MKNEETIVDVESNQNTINNELIMNQIIHLLGVSVIWFVMLIVGDWYSTENDLLINDRISF